jgi:hypothetical protein
MRRLTLFVAFLVVVVGLVGIVSPDRLLSIAPYVITPVGLYVVAGLRIAIGLVLMRVAPASRAPRVLQLVGAIVLIAGVALPFTGLERTRAIVAWESSQGSTAIRAAAALAVAFGAFVAFAIAAPRSSLVADR